MLPFSGAASGVVQSPPGARYATRAGEPRWVCQAAATAPCSPAAILASDTNGSELDPMTSGEPIEPSASTCSTDTSLKPCHRIHAPFPSLARVTPAAVVVILVGVDQT